MLLCNSSRLGFGLELITGQVLAPRDMCGMEALCSSSSSEGVLCFLWPEEGEGHAADLLLCLLAPAWGFLQL